MRWLIILPLLLFSCIGREETGYIYISGRIEGNEYYASSKYPGRVLKLLHDEGDDVRKGELLAVLDSKEVSARFKQADANYRSSLSQLEAKRHELDYYRNRLKSLRAKLSNLEKTVNLNIRISEENLSLSRRDREIAKAMLEEARSTYERVRRDYERYRNLYRRRVISESTFDSFRNRFEVSRQKLKAAQESLKKSSKAVEIAKEKLEVAKAGLDEVRSVRMEVKALASTVKAKEKELEALKIADSDSKARLEEAQAVLDDMRIRSPVNGTITERSVEVGEVIPSGFRLFTIYNLDDLYFEGFIPEKEVGLLRIGQRGFITVDSYPNRKFPVRVIFISSRAEFTPKEVQTKEERVKQVFRVKLKLIENPGHILKPGMPADAYLEISG